MTIRMVSPARNRGQSLYWSVGVSGWLHLLRIDLKRGGGVWIVPAAAVASWLVLRNSLTPGVALWPEITSSIFNLSNFLTIIVVAAGGMVGGRERRRELAEQTAATAMAVWQRYLSLTVSLYLWALTAYALVALPLMTYGAFRATWGGPDVSVLIVQIPVMALGAVFGVSVGRIIRERTAAVVAVAAFFLLFVILTMVDQSLYLLNVLGLNSWLRPMVENPPERPVNVLFQLAWVSGLVGTIVGFGIWWERRTLMPRLLTVISIAMACNGAVAVVTSGAPQQSTQMGSWRLTVPVESVCDDTQAIEVCVHPAYERMLSSVSHDVNTFLEPLAGMDGVVEQVYISSGNQQGGGWDEVAGRIVVSIDISFRSPPEMAIAMEAWNVSLLSPDYRGPGGDTVQYVVMTALGRSISVEGWPQWLSDRLVISDTVALQDAIDRFADLTPDQQHEWLEGNWDALRAGELTLEDLP